MANTCVHSENFIAQQWLHIMAEHFHSFLLQSCDIQICLSFKRKNTLCNINYVISLCPFSEALHKQSKIMSFSVNFYQGRPTIHTCKEFRMANINSKNVPLSRTTSNPIIHVIPNKFINKHTFRMVAL